MRQWMRPGGRRSASALAVVLTALTMLVSGCAGGHRVGDGHIGTEWAVFAEAKVPTPGTGVCRQGSDGQVGLDLAVFTADVITCRDYHLTETYHVGLFTGAAAEGAQPPALGDDGLAEAFQICQDAATSFLGDAWLRARVAIVPVPPTSAQWRGQARWFRCEMLEVSDASDTIVPRMTSLRDGLRDSAPAALTCAKDAGRTAGTVDTVDFVDCATPHTVEFAGAQSRPAGPYPGHEAASRVALKGCATLGARYLGLTESALRARSDLAWLAIDASEQQWQEGDRSYRCFIGTADRGKPITGSIHNLGSHPLPR
jgi:hypothetical protein